MDFTGIQNYTREIVTHTHFIPFVNAKIIKANKRNVDRTLMNWEIYPPSIFKTIETFTHFGLGAALTEQMRGT